MSMLFFIKFALLFLMISCTWGAADYSADYHLNQGMKYLSYHLKDHVRENIEGSFYEAIEFI